MNGSQVANQSNFSYGGLAFIWAFRGLKRGLKFLDRLKVSSYEDSGWNLSPNVNKLFIAGIELKVQVLETWCKETSTFLWAWANPSPEWSDECKCLSREVRSIGESQGIAIFTEPKHHMDRNEAFMKLVALCAYFDDVHAVHGMKGTKDFASQTLNATCHHPQQYELAE